MNFTSSSFTGAGFHLVDGDFSDGSAPPEQNRRIRALLGAPRRGLRTTSLNQFDQSNTPEETLPASISLRSSSLSVEDGSHGLALAGLIQQ
ncbi:hypothetical protein VTN00DRAFT_4777 [Thermoascus crustaceus]|uniref:uncharacterized protein n=1 Tax=Thermoascus crustaceus TaxID=5088 RepID=UPI003742F06A